MKWIHVLRVETDSDHYVQCFSSERKALDKMREITGEFETELQKSTGTSVVVEKEGEILLLVEYSREMIW